MVNLKLALFLLAPLALVWLLGKFVFKRLYHLKWLRMAILFTFIGLLLYILIFPEYARQSMFRVARWML